MRGYLSLLLFFGLSLGQVLDPITVEEDSNEVIAEEKSILNKHNISVGMFDDRTGLSLIGYTYNIKQTAMDEYFIGAGTMLLAFTGTVGWKHYTRKPDYPFLLFFVVSMSHTWVLWGFCQLHLLL